MDPVIDDPLLHDAQAGDRTALCRTDACDLGSGLDVSAATL
jgi:hypothetical protein